MEERKKEEGKMKRLTLIALLLIVLTTGAFAHQGSIGLYTNTSASDCDLTFTPFVGTDIYILYYRSDAGPDGITATEFKVGVDAAALILGAFTPSPEVSVTLGAIATGLSCSFTGCTGTGSDYVLIGQVSIIALAAVPTQIKVLASNDLPAPPLEPRVSMCDDPARTIVGVLGGWFTAPDGSCSVGTEEKTWGAIKEMYKD
jgi:hypothetical protein